MIVVEHAAEVAARTAPIKAVMRDAAATEPSVRALIRQDHDRRYVTQQALVDVVIEGTPLRPGLGRDDAVATFFALMNSHTYRLLSEQLGWTAQDWKRWLVNTLQREFFAAEPAPVRCEHHR